MTILQVSKLTVRTETVHFIKQHHVERQIGHTSMLPLQTQNYSHAMDNCIVKDFRTHAIHSQECHHLQAKCNKSDTCPHHKSCTYRIHYNQNLLSLLTLCSLVKLHYPTFNYSLLMTHEVNQFNVFLQEGCLISLLQAACSYCEKQRIKVYNC